MLGAPVGQGITPRQCPLAEGEPGVYVARASVMHQANISGLGEFLGIAEYLAGLGFIAEGINDYEFFVLTLEGIAAGARY